jgi:hypothetical protein
MATTSIPAPTVTTLQATQTPPAVFPTETLTPTSTPEPTATPEAETITFLRSGVEKVTMLKKDTITFELSNGETITMPKIYMAGVEPGYNVDRLVEKALEFIVADGVAWGIFGRPDNNYKPNDPNDPYSKYWNNFLLIPGVKSTGGALVPNSEAIPDKDRFGIGINAVNGPIIGTILGYKSDTPKKYSRCIFLVNADAESVKAYLISDEANIPPRPNQ